jgi:hypothetical protein
MALYSLDLPSKQEIWPVAARLTLQQSNSSLLVLFLSCFQEFLAAKEVVKRVRESAFSAEKVIEIFGKWSCSRCKSQENSCSASTCEICAHLAKIPEGRMSHSHLEIFTDTHWQVMLPMCADLLTNTSTDTIELAAFATVLFDASCAADVSSGQGTLST